jgi:hypothetical protein
VKKQGRGTIAQIETQLFICTLQPLLFSDRLIDGSLQRIFTTMDQPVHPFFHEFVCHCGE